MPTQNLWQKSKAFGTAPWTLLGSTGAIANNTSDTLAPDGTATASKYTDAVDGGAVVHNVGQAYTARVSGVVMVMSVFVKAGTLSQLALLSEDGVTEAFYNLTTGVISTSAGTPIDYGMRQTGNGWFLAWLVYKSSGGTARNRFALGKTGVRTYQGDGTGTLYLWQGQLEQANAVGEICVTDTVAVDNGAPANKRHMQNFISDTRLTSTGWAVTNATRLAGQAGAPDGSSTAIKLTEDSSTNYHRFYYSTSIADSLLVPKRKTQTVYAKAGTRNWLFLDMNDAAGTHAWFDLSTGQIGQIQTGMNGQHRMRKVIDSSGQFTGWYKCSVTHEFTSTSYAISFGLTSGNGIITGVGDGTGTMFFWDPQFTGSDAEGDDVSVLTTGQSFIQQAIADQRYPQNFFASSGDFSSTWTNTCGVSTSGQPDPLGGTSAWLLGDNSAGAFQLVGLTFAIPPNKGTTICVSVLVKKNPAATSGCGFNINMVGGSAAAISPRMSPVDGSQGGSPSTITDLGTGWFLWESTITNDGTSSSMTVNFFPATSGLPVGVDAATAIGNQTVYGMQVEQSNARGDTLVTGALAVNIVTAHQRISPPQNINSRSSDFNNWTKNGITAGLDAIGPDGVANSASTLHDSVDGVSTSHNVINPTTNSAPVGTVWTSSVIAKKGTKDKIAICPGSATYQITFDLTNGVVGQTLNSTTIISRCEPIKAKDGSIGWFKCSVTWAQIAGSVGGTDRIYMVNALNAINYQGDGTGTVILYGAKCEQTDAAGEPVITVATGLPSTVYGRPRFRTGQNLILQSRAIATAPWADDATATRSNNYTLATDPKRTFTASRVIFAGGSLNYFYQNVTWRQGATHTYSIWMRTISGSTTIQMALDVVTLNVTLDTTWRIFSITAPNVTATSSNALIQNITNGAADFLVWDANVEQSNGRGDHMPTISPIYQNIAVAAFNPSGAPPNYRTIS